MSRYLINSLTEMKSTIKELIKHDRLSHDTETYGPPDVGGLFPFHGSRSFSHIFATHEDEFYYNFNTGGINPKYKADLQEVFEERSRIFFYVNAVFDNTIMHYDGLKNKGRIVDCPAIARVEFNEHGKQKWMDESFLSLAYLAEYYQVTLKDDRVKKYIEEHNLYSPVPCRFNGEKIPLYDRVPLDLMFEYGCGDARSTFDTGQAIIKCINYKDELYENHRFNEGKMIDVAKNEIALTSVLVDMKISGFELDIDYVNKAIVYEKEQLKKLTSEVRALVGDDMNLNSGKQLADYLQSKGVELPRKEVTETALKRAGAWAEKAEIAKEAAKKANGSQRERLLQKAREYGEKGLEYTKGNCQTDKKTLAKLLMKYPDLDFLTKVTHAKEAEKKISAYYENFLLFRDDKNIIHCSINQEKAKTGRVSITDPALQTLEKKPSVLEWGVRKAFTTFDPDYDLFFLDYEQQEMIVMLDQAGEMSVIEKLKSGEFKDFYLATMAVIKETTGREITRQQAKAIALGLAYGQGIDLLAYNLGLTRDEAIKLKDAFFEALPALGRLKIRLENQVKRYGKIHNPYGRVSYIDKNGSYKALNSFVQGTSADITKTAMVNISAFLRANNCKSEMKLQVHDELIFRIHKAERHIIPDLKRIMSEAYPHLHIPLETGVEIGRRSWGEKEEYEFAS